MFIAPGASLKTARVERGLTIERAAESLRLGNDVLQLLEAEQFESFSSLIYVGAYLRPYAELLGLEPEPLLKAVLVVCRGRRPTGTGVTTASAAAMKPEAPAAPRTREAAAADARRLEELHKEQGADRPVLRQRLGATVAVIAALAAVAGGLLTSSGGQLQLSARSVQDWAERVLPTTVPTVEGPSPQAAPLSKKIAPPPPPPPPAARTTVQVLGGSGDEGRVRSAAGTLRALGYDVVATDTLRRRSRRTAVLATEGSQDQAAALVAGDRRFGEVRTAPAFRVQAALHVVVGSDWPQD